MIDVRKRLMALRGWKRWGLSFLLGAVMTLAFAPIYVIPAVFLCLPAFAWLLDGTKQGRYFSLDAFVTAWFFAFGHFITGIYWVTASLFVDIELYWWLVPFSLAGLPAILAVFYGVAYGVARRLGRAGSSSRLIIYALAWSAAEYARGHLFTGFPWNLVGNIWSGYLPVLQGAALFGVYGLGLLTLVLCFQFARIGEHTTSSRLYFLPIPIGVLLLGLLAGWGSLRLDKIAALPDQGITIRIVQPNITQPAPLSTPQGWDNLHKMLELTAKDNKDVDVTIWPEAIYYGFLSQDEDMRRMIGSALADHAYGIIGGFRPMTLQDGKIVVANGLDVINYYGKMIASYEKFHLVPFGEYIPFRRWLPFEPVAAGSADIHPGKGLKTLSLSGIPFFSPLICYEVIFPGQVRTPDNKSLWIVNLTDDRWFGPTTGPHQHLAIAQARAVEEGVPIARSANTGISAVIDGGGQLHKTIHMSDSGYIDYNLPSALPDKTFFSRHGKLVFILKYAIFMLMVVLHGFMASENIHRDTDFQR